MSKTSSFPKNLKTLLPSLAVSDLGVGMIVQPFYLTVLVMQLEQNCISNPTLKIFYVAFVVAAHLLHCASFFGVTALTEDRFLAVYLHLRYNELVTHKHVVLAVILIWMLSAILSLIKFFVSEKTASVIFGFFGAVCLTTTAVLYCKIYLVVRQHVNQIHAMQIQHDAQNCEMANAARLRKSAFGTFYVYLVFLVCYLLQNCVYYITGSSTAIVVFKRCTLTMTFLNHLSIL